MALLKTSRQDKGFSLVEIMIAVAILVVILGLGLFVSFDFYRSYAFRSEKSNIVSILQKARGQSLNNINQARHGVHFENSPSLRYIIFECDGATLQCSGYADHDPSADITIEASYGISFVSPTPSLPFDIVFDQLNGDCVSCSTPIVITASDGASSYDILVNSEGRIDWE